MDGGAFGAGKSGGPFDPMLFVRKPQVIVRLVSLFFSIIVFGCISSQGWIGNKCSYGHPNACSFGTAIGVIAFLGLIALLAIDALFDHSAIFSSVKNRKYAVIGDMGFSGFWTFMWFVCFCYLTDSWRTAKAPPDGHGVSGVQAAIAFSFFSIASFGGSTFFAVQRYRTGISTDAFTSNFEPEAGGGQGGEPYSGYTGDGQAPADPYQPPETDFQTVDNSTKEYLDHEFGRNHETYKALQQQQPFGDPQAPAMDTKTPPTGDYNAPTY